MTDRKIKLQIKNMTKKYANGDGVENIDLDVYEGEFVTMLGPSGCGKSTILRTLGGFLNVDDGEILLDGAPIHQLPPEKRPTAMVFQSYNLWPHMTIYENLTFGLKIRKVEKKEMSERADKMLELVGMTGHGKKYPGQLSGGQQQRVAIARALLLKPSVLLLDEPFSALDAKIRQQMREELKKIQSELNITVVFVTHDQEEAMALSHRIVVMNKGVFEQIGTANEIYDNPKSKYVASFIGEMNFIEDGNKIVSVRPENVVVEKGGDGKYTGSVVTVMMLGHYAEILVDVKGKLIRSYVNRNAASKFSEREEVSLSFTKQAEYDRD